MLQFLFPYFSKEIASLIRIIYLWHINLKQTGAIRTERLETISIIHENQNEFQYGNKDNIDASSKIII